MCSRSKKDKSKGVAKSESSDPEPEGLTLLVPDIQRTAEIVYAATTNLRQANQGMYKQPNMRLYYLKKTTVFAKFSFSALFALNLKALRSHCSVHLSEHSTYPDLYKNKF